MCKSSGLTSVKLATLVSAAVLIIATRSIEGKPHVVDIDCIPVTECPMYDNYLRQRPLSSARIAVVRAAHCGFEQLIEKVWCPILDELANKTVEMRTSNVKSTKNKNNTRSDVFPSAEECGQQSDNRILGGNATELDEFPWTAMLFYRSQSSNKQLIPRCGGTLISKRYVVTAAHCVTPQLALVVLGEYDTRNESDCNYYAEDDIECAPKPIKLLIEEVIKFPSPADVPTYVNDIALLKLEKDVTFHNYIAPICLSSRTNHDLKQDTLVFAAGWGQFGFNRNSTRSPVKLKVGLPVVSRANCSIAQGINITSNMICAGGAKNKDTCQGDSGGPLMFFDVQTLSWHLIGIVSISTKQCGTNGVPAVYTWLPGYIDWIYQNAQ